MFSLIDEKADLDLLVKYIGQEKHIWEGEKQTSKNMF